MKPRTLLLIIATIMALASITWDAVDQISSRKFQFRLFDFTGPIVLFLAWWLWFQRKKSN